MIDGMGLDGKGDGEEMAGIEGGEFIVSIHDLRKIIYLQKEK